MASRGHVVDTAHPIRQERELVRTEPARQAYNLLHVAYTLVPLVAGVDKFFHKLVNWDQYLSPTAANVLKGHGHEFMLAVGVIEIIAALGVIFKPRVFGVVVAAWLWAIIVNLVVAGGYLDIALRDFGLSLGALALAQLSRDFDRHPVVDRHAHVRHHDDVERDARETERDREWRRDRELREHEREREDERRRALDREIDREREDARERDREYDRERRRERDR